MREQLEARIKETNEKIGECDALLAASERDNDKPMIKRGTLALHSLRGYRNGLEFALLLLK